MRILRAFQDAILVRRLIARMRTSMEHSSPEAMKEYLHEHPGADKSNHHVRKKDEKSKAKEETSSSPGRKSKDLFSKEEIDKLPEKAKQPTGDIKKIYEQAHVAHEKQLDMLNRGKGLDKEIGGTVIRGDKGEKVDFDKPGPVILIGPLKKEDRVNEKVTSDYGGDYSQIRDIVRASVAVDSMDQLEDVVSKLKKAGLKLAKKPNDRFAKPTEAGYRDLMMNVEYPNGHIGELQLHLKGVLKAKDAGHKFYEEVRTIEANAKKDGRTTLTDEETKKINEANHKMQGLYQQAWDTATKGPDKTKNAMMRAATTSGVKYYEYQGLPAYWEPKKFPRLVTPKGERVIYELQKFFQEANPISEQDFHSLKGKRAN